MKKKIESYSKSYWLIMLIFFGIFTVGQCLISYYWNKEVKFIDVFQIVLAPACCFSIASLFGLYRGKLLFVTTFYVWFLGNIFYAIFQKFSFFKESDLSSLFLTNVKIFGIPLAIQSFISVIICYLVLKKMNDVSIKNIS